MLLAMWEMLPIPATGPSWYSAPVLDAPTCPECGCTNHSVHPTEDGELVQFACGAQLDDGLRTRRCRAGAVKVRQRVTLKDWWRGFVDVEIPKEMRRK